MVVVAGRSASWIAGVPVEIDERRDDPAAHEGGERPLAGDGRARTGHEQADRTAIGVRGRSEAGHDDDGDGAVGGAPPPEQRYQAPQPRRQPRHSDGERSDDREAPAAARSTAAKPDGGREARADRTGAVHPLTASPSPGRPRPTRRPGRRAPARSAPRPPRRERRRQRGRARRCSPRRLQAAASRSPASPSIGAGRLDRPLDPVRLEHVGGPCHRRRTEAEQGVRPDRDRPR